MRHSVANKALRATECADRPSTRSNSGLLTKCKSVTVLLLRRAEHPVQPKNKFDGGRRARSSPLSRAQLERRRRSRITRFLERRPRHRRQLRLAALEQMLRVPPIFRCIDVEALGASREKRHHDLTHNGAALAHHPAARDLVARVLLEKHKQNKKEKTVPRLLRGAERQQGQEP